MVFFVHGKGEADDGEREKIQRSHSTDNSSKSGPSHLNNNDIEALLGSPGDANQSIFQVEVSSPPQRSSDDFAKNDNNGTSGHKRLNLNRGDAWNIDDLHTLKSTLENVGELSQGLYSHDDNDDDTDGEIEEVALLKEDKLTTREIRYLRTLVDDHRTRKTQQEEENGVEFAQMNDDTFSFLLTTPVGSAPFSIGFMIVMLKATIYALILASMLNLDHAQNPLNIPANLSWPIVVSQVVALFITVISQDDLITGMTLVHEGYKHEYIEAAFPQARWIKWYIATWLLCLVGLLGLFVTFLLLITSVSVASFFSCLLGDSFRE